MNRLSIILVNYRSEDDIIQCLSSAFQWESAASFEWIVVNNDTCCSRKAEILHLFPGVMWLDMGYNAGFARANNRGIFHSSGEALLLLNPDTVILDNAIENCFLRLMAGSCLAASVQLLNEDLTPQITGNFFMKGGLNHLLPLPYAGAFLRKIALAAGTKKTNIEQAGTLEKVDWINGAFLMVKRQAIEKTGLLDEDFFLYFEEIEWCSRLGKAGDLCVFGDLKTIHLQGESVSKSTDGAGKGYRNVFDKKGLQLMVSQHLRIRKQFGRGWLLLHLLVHVAEIPLFFFLAFSDRLIHGSNPFTDFPQVAAYTKNVIRLLKAAPKMWSGKPYFYKVL